ncbi:MAG TPA: hypothetical protein VFK03_04765, partial [Candidatus Saccharimonadales bacterium]|nr:hypothetical protein [Candidatus Saccharimonadales bacterium]
MESFKGKNVTKLVAQQYDNQKLRGQEGFGLYDPTRNHLVRNTKEKRILNWLGKHKSSSILFHHRFPTSTDNVKNACHPFSTKDFFKTNYVLVHNGHISNSYSLKREHEKLGIKYHSVQSNGRFNDSEALLWDVALYLEGQQSELKAEGNIAFICLAQPKDGRKTRKLYFGRNTNPLNLHFSKQTLMLSSEGPGEATEAHQLYEYNYRTKKLTHQPLDIPIYRPVTSTTTYGSDYSTYPWDNYGNYSASRWEDDDVEPE